MGKSSGGGSSTTVQKADPWVGVQPGLNKLYQKAVENFDSGGPQYYPGQTIADPNWNIQHSLNLGQAQALGGAPATANAQALNAQTTGGSFLNNNPYLDQMYKSATDPMVAQFKNATAPGLASQFSMAGRMGSGAANSAMGTAEDSLGRSLANASSQIYGGAYENERTRQQQAMSMAPGLDQAMYDPANKLMGIGQFQQSQQQDQINSAIQKYNYGQQLPTQNLQVLNSLLQGGSAYAGSTSSQNQSNARNPFASAIGGAAAASSIGGALGGGLGGAIGGPWGMAAGALLSGLFG